MKYTELKNGDIIIDYNIVIYGELRLTIPFTKNFAGHLGDNINMRESDTVMVYKITTDTVIYRLMLYKNFNPNYEESIYRVENKSHISSYCEIQDHIYIFDNSNMEILYRFGKYFKIFIGNKYLVKVDTDRSQANEIMAFYNGLKVGIHYIQLIQFNDNFYDFFRRNAEKARGKMEEEIKKNKMCILV